MSYSFHNKRPPGRKWILPGVGLLATLIFGGILFTFLFAAREGESIELTPVASSDDGLIVFCGEADGGIYVVQDNGTDAKITYASLDGEKILQTSLAKSDDRFVILGDSLGIITLNRIDDCVSLVYVHPYEESLESFGETTFIFEDGLPEKALYTVTDDNQLCVAPTGGTLTLYSDFVLDVPPTKTGWSSIDFLNTSADGTTYAHSEGILFGWRGNDLNDHQEYKGTEPFSMLNGAVYLDITGAICVPTDGSCVAVLSGVEGACASSNDEIYVADKNLGTIEQYSMDAELLGNCYIDGNIQALTPSGVLAEKDGIYCFGRYDFIPIPEETEEPGPTEEPQPTEDIPATETPGETSSPPDQETPEPEDSSEPDNTDDPTPTNSPEPDFTPEPAETPTPTPEPEDTPNPSEEPPASPTPGTPIYLPDGLMYMETSGVEGEYIVLNSKFNVDLLRQYLFQATLIKDQNGKSVYSGPVKTGMTADDKTIVVLGDCDGSGYLTSRDIYLIEEYMVNIRGFDTEAIALAADVNMDGEITTMDLVCISNEIAERTLSK